MADSVLSSSFLIAVYKHWMHFGLPIYRAMDS